MPFHGMVQRQKRYFLSQITKGYAHRRDALQALKKAIYTYEEDIYEALYQDLGKAQAESFLTEVGVVLSEISHTLQNLKKWMKPERTRSPLTLFKAQSKIYHDPYGIVLVLSPWNYPFQLAINPLVGALAAGNTVIVKPSSSSVHTSRVLEKMLHSVFPEEYVQTVLGTSDRAEELLHEDVDFIFFTGSMPVGKKVMKIAAEKLIPVTLELGGKSPAIIDTSKNLELAAKRIVFGKLINAGQTCIAPDYVLLRAKDKKMFTSYFQKYVEVFYGENPLKNDTYPKIINRHRLEHLKALINGEKILVGGEVGRDKISPTLLDEITFASPVMQEEIFGPVLPMICYDNIDDIIYILQKQEKPLALYLFTENKKVENKICHFLSFGGGTINDTLMHFVNHYTGFGGVGASGMGRYHGYESFRTFSHQKPILHRSTKIDIQLRYHPLNNRKLKIAKWLLK